MIEAENELIKYRNKINEIEVKLKSNNHDKQSAIMTIHPGAGEIFVKTGTEMLYGIYDRWMRKILKINYLISVQNGWH